MSLVHISCEALDAEMWKGIEKLRKKKASELLKCCRRPAWVIPKFDANMNATIPDQLI